MLVSASQHIISDVFIAPNFASVTDLFSPVSMSLMIVLSQDFGLFSGGNPPISTDGDTCTNSPLELVVKYLPCSIIISISFPELFVTMTLLGVSPVRSSHEALSFPVSRSCTEAEIPSIC